VPVLLRTKLSRRLWPAARVWHGLGRSGCEKMTIAAGELALSTAHAREFWINERFEQRRPVGAARNSGQRWWHPSGAVDASRFPCSSCDVCLHAVDSDRLEVRIAVA